MIDFSQISSIISENFDTDKITVKRNGEGRLVTIYSDIPAHISFSSPHTPPINDIDIHKIDNTLTINLSTSYIILNDDYIYAYKLDNLGNTLHEYCGRCGNPDVSQSRQRLTVKLNKTDANDNTDIPIYENYYRQMLNGTYRKNNGELERGHHLFRAMKVDSINGNVIVCDNAKEIHPDDSIYIEVKKDCKLKLYPDNRYVKIANIDSISSGKVTFTVSDYIPTQEETNAYVCGWYDGHSY